MPALAAVGGLRKAPLLRTPPAGTPEHNRPIGAAALTASALPAAIDDPMLRTDYPSNPRRGCKCYRGLRKLSEPKPLKYYGLLWQFEGQWHFGPISQDPFGPAPSPRYRAITGKPQIIARCSEPLWVISGHVILTASRYREALEPLAAR